METRIQNIEQDTEQDTEQRTDRRLEQPAASGAGGKREELIRKGPENVQAAANETAEDAAYGKRQGQNDCSCGHYKIIPRDATGQKQLQNRINRIIGQLNGIKNMIGENRYCGDILIQIGAVESALQSLGYIILQEHMQTCVVEEVKNGNEAIMEEAIELIKKLK